VKPLKKRSNPLSVVAATGARTVLRLALKYRLVWKGQDRTERLFRRLRQRWIAIRSVLFAQRHRRALEGRLT
jgi:hypothetical protein